MLDLLTAAPKEIKFGEQTLRVGALKLYELGLLTRWIRDHSKRPTEEIEATLRFYPEEEHRKLRIEAVQADKNWPPPVGTVQGNTILFGDPDGQLYFLAVFLRKYQPDLGDADLQRIAQGLSELDFGALVTIAFGEDDLDPEAARAAAEARVELARAAALSAAPTGDNSSPASSSSLPT